MRLASVVFAGAILMGAAPVFAGAHSDYTKSFPLQSLQTFEFRTQQRISRDPLANNAIWAENIRDDIRTGLMSRGLTEVAAEDMPDFYVTYYVGVAERYSLNAIGFHRGWWGWPGVYTMTVAGPPPLESSTAPASPTRIASDRVGVSSVVSSAGCRRPSSRLPSTSIRIQTGRVVFNTTRDGETPRFSTVAGGAGDDAIADVPLDALDALFEGA